MPTRLFAKEVVRKLVNAGHTAYFAGGWVRDFLMQHPSDDIDIATSASVSQVQALFPKTIPVGVNFGIVIVVWEGHSFEVATFRKDRGYVDGRRPTGVDPATPEEDAMRRDFTINGMFYDPLQETLYDYVGGQKDIGARIIRAIGNPHERFLEDRLRMMRAVRYSTRFDFPIEENTRRAIIDHSATLLPAVAMERIWQEFKKMSRFAHFNIGLEMLYELNLLQTIFPSLKSVSCEEIKTHLSYLHFYPQNTPTIAELLELFPTYSREEVLALCEYLKLSSQERDFACLLHHAKQMLLMPEKWREDLENIEWTYFYSNPSMSVVLEIIAARFTLENRQSFLKEHAMRQRKLHPFIVRMQQKNPVVRSEHLLEVGVAAGKQMGLLLKEAERIAANAETENRDEVIKLLKNSPLWQNGRA